MYEIICFREARQDHKISKYRSFLATNFNMRFTDSLIIFAASSLKLHLTRFDPMSMIKTKGVRVSAP